MREGERLLGGMREGLFGEERGRESSQGGPREGSRTRARCVRYRGRERGTGDSVLHCQHMQEGEFCNSC